MSSFSEWMPLLRGRSQPSREELLDEESFRHEEEAEEGSAGVDEDLEPPAQPSVSKRGAEDTPADLTTPLMRRELPAAANPIAFSRSWKEEQVHHGHAPSLGFAPDRGAGYYANARSTFHRPSLLQTGRHVADTGNDLCTVAAQISGTRVTAAVRARL